MLLILYFEVKKIIKNMPYKCINDPKILNNPIVLIYLNGFCNWFYVSTTELYICNCFRIFITLITPEQIIIEKSGWGNNIYSFLKINIPLLVNLLKTSFYTYI